MVTLKQLEGLISKLMTVKFLDSLAKMVLENPPP